MEGRTGMLLAVLAVALLHPLVQARVRPLYQVSDEMAYLRTAQLEAFVGAAPSSDLCIAPPDGVPLETGEGGKRGYAVVTGAQLRLLCGRGGTGLPLFALRGLQALSLPVVALAAWYLSRLVSGSHHAALLAAFAVAVHPVAAKYAGGVTPDAWANAFSAGVFVGLTRITLGRHRWWDIWLIAACALAGMLWKDTAHMLVPLAALGLGVAVWHALTNRDDGRSGPRWGLLASLGAAAIASVVAIVRAWDALLTRYVQQIPDDQAGVLAEPLRFGEAVLDDVLAQTGGYVSSSLQSLYRPLVYGPATATGQPLTPDVATFLIGALLMLGLVGALSHWVRPQGRIAHLPTRVAGVWGVAICLAVVQPSMRLVLLDSDGLHQGRWLFPVLAPVAALTGIGLAHLAGQRQERQALAVLAGLTGLWVVVLDMVRHYYASFPRQLSNAMLFTRPTGETDIGDAAVLRLIADTTAGQDSAVTWGILVLLMVASLALAIGVTRHARSPAPHV